MGTPRTDGITTAALRAGSPAVLAEGFAAQVAFLRGRGPGDPRDLMLDLAPLTDCARRLGADPAALFLPLVADGPEWVRETVERFVRRTDVTLGAFGWGLVEEPEGPAYRFLLRGARPPGA